jgi:transposase InsO family protein
MGEPICIWPICKVLPIAPSTYHKHVAERHDPSLQSTRAQRDLALKPEVQRVFDANFGVYGVRKVWRQLNREGFDVARCTVERLMRELGLAGVIRGKPVRTTVSNKAAANICRSHTLNDWQKPTSNHRWAASAPQCSMLPRSICAPRL